LLEQTPTTALLLQPMKDFSFFHGLFPNIAGNMKDWEYTFDPVSKAEWIRQITSDLKQKPVESLMGEWWEGESRWPLLHAEDMNDEVVRLPDFLFNKPPQIIEHISVEASSPESVNQAILEALQFGTQSVILQVTSTEEIFNPEWIKDVHLDWITFQIEQDELSEAPLTSFIESLPEHSLYRVLRGPTAKPLSSILWGEKPTALFSISAFRFVYYFPSVGNWIEKTRIVLNALLDDLQHWNAKGFETSVFFKQCILAVEADQDFFKQIIQTRSLHVLWQNLNQYYTQNAMTINDRYLETHIEQKDEEKPDLFLVRASMSALAASLAGTGALCIHQSKEDTTPLFYQRINRNIHHLLELESGMYKGIDPLSGAYSIDFHLKRWATSIWIHLNMDNKGGRLDV
jgi:hypothetical protein